MTALQARELIGATGTIVVKTESFQVQVEVMDVRNVWGRDQFHVAPISGKGSAWVDANRVTINESRS